MKRKTENVSSLTGKHAVLERVKIASKAAWKKMQLVCRITVTSKYFSYFILAAILVSFPTLSMAPFTKVFHSNLVFFSFLLGRG